ncbi:MAG: hypothetical protein KI788_06300 [Mameliella sp.]|nr:hypothetical protein [Mameliella sp.]
MKHFDLYLITYRNDDGESYSSFVSARSPDHAAEIWVEDGELVGDFAPIARSIPKDVTSRFLENNPIVRKVTHDHRVPGPLEWRFGAGAPLIGAGMVDAAHYIPEAS